MSDRFEDFETVTRLVQACFNQLRAMGDELHKSAGITAAQRALLETLHEEGPQTVPMIARGKGVSRQHIQVLADSLIAMGLIEALDNPAHKRSALLQAKRSGRELFERMKRRETMVIREFAERYNERELRTAIAVLKTMRAQLGGFVQERRNEP